MRLIKSSPREWGCFYDYILRGYSQGVFPTRVGVFLRGLITGERRICLPHASGGVSTVEKLIIRDLKSSPREWGCFYESMDVIVQWTVFPTRVGVFLHREWAGK